MNSEKREKRSYNNLPYDCWSKVVSYYKGKEEFLSLNLSIKGLYEYINRIIPQCTKQIEFKITKLSALPPATKPREYVTSLFFSDKKNEFKDFSCTQLEVVKSEPEDLRSLLKYLPKAFPNLLKLTLDLRRTYTTEARRRERYVSLPPLPFLKVLKITISQTVVVIDECNSKDGYLQNLEELTLINAVPISNKKIGLGRKPKYFHNVFLVIYGDNCLPKLKKLELCGWEIYFNSPALTHPNLKNLLLENMMIVVDDCHYDFRNASSVESLTIHSPYYEKEKIQKLFKNVKRLSINFSPKYKFISKDLLCYRKVRVSINWNFEMKNLPNLEEIEFLDTFYDLPKRIKVSMNNRKIEFINLPKLKKVVIRSISKNIKEVTFRNTSSVEILDLSFSSDNKTKITLPIGSAMKEMCLKNIHLNEQSTRILQYFKNLQVLEIIGVCDNKKNENYPKIILEDMNELKRVKLWKKNQLVKVRKCKKLETLDFYLSKNSPFLEDLPMLKTKLERT